MNGLQSSQSRREWASILEEAALPARWRSVGDPALRHFEAQLWSLWEVPKEEDGLALWGELEVRRSRVGLAGHELPCRHTDNFRCLRKEKWRRERSATTNARVPDGVMRCFPVIRPNLRALWTHNHAPISARRRVGQIALSSTDGEATSDTGDQPGNVRPQQEDGQQDTLRKPQPQSALLSPSSKLPLSPLMDPNLIAARQRYRTPKPVPSGELSAFSKKLEKNPYGPAPRLLIFFVKKAHKADSGSQLKHWRLRSASADSPASGCHSTST